MLDVSAPFLGRRGEGSSLSRSVLAVRLVLLSLALLAVAVAFRSVGFAPASGISYSCPMHPEVKSQHAGDCPVCGMALEALQPATRAPDTAASTADGAAGRSYVKPAVQHVFSQAIEAPAWIDENGLVQAVFYNDELLALAEGEPFARFGPRGAQQLTLSRTPEPPEQWDEATSRVAFQLRAAAKAPPVHSVGRVLLPAGRRSALVVPEDAMLALDDGPYVLVRGGEGFEQRPLRIGKTQYDMVTVASGLIGHEPVVVRNAFVLDAERRLRAGLGSMP